MAGRITQLAVEALIDPPDAAARITQLAVEALIDPPDPAARITQFAVEALITVNAVADQLDGSGETGLSLTITLGATGQIGEPLGDGTETGLSLTITQGTGGVLLAALTGGNGLALTLTPGATGQIGFPLDGSVTTGLSLTITQGTGGELKSPIFGFVGLSLTCKTGIGGALLDLGAVEEDIIAYGSQFRVYVKGVDFSPYVRANSINGHRELNFTATANLGLIVNKNYVGTDLVVVTSTTLAVGINASVTSITLTDASLFSAADVLVRITNGSTTEYVWMISRSGNVLTVRRGEQSSTPAIFSGGVTVSEMFIPAGYVPPLPFVPDIGMPIDIWYYDAQNDGLPKRTSEWWKIFGGMLQRVGIKKTHVTFEEVEYALQCVDYSNVLTRRLFKGTISVAVYPTINSALAYLNTYYFEPEGLSYIPPATDVALPADIEFQTETRLNDVLSKLGEITNLEWAVDFDRVLRFFDRPALITTAPYDLTEDTAGANSDLWYDLDLTKDRGLYRNKQYINATYSVSTQVVTVSYTAGVDERPSAGYPYLKQWLLIEIEPGFPVAPFLTDWTYSGKVNRVIRMQLNGVDQTFYTQGNDPPANWHWYQTFPDNLDFAFNTVGYATAQQPNTGDVLTITFELKAETPQPVVEEDAAEIAARRAIEGIGTGIYEAVENLPDISSQALAIEYAQNLLARFGTMGREAVFGTDVMGFDPGQQIDVTLPSYDVASDTFKIESIGFQETAKLYIKHVVKATNSIMQRDALAAFDRLIKRLRKGTRTVVDVVVWDAARSNPPFTNPGLVTGTAVGNPYIVRAKSISLKDLAILAKTPPQGADASFQVKRNGTALLVSPAVYPANETGVVIYQNWAGGASPTLYEGDVLTLDVVSTGTTQPGKDFTLALRGFA